MDKSSDKLFIPSDWKKWIAENVILGNCPDDLKRVLVEKGYPADLASLEVDAAASHPYVDAAQSLGRKLKKRDWVLNTSRILENQKESSVERRADVSPEEFFREYYFKNRPVILLGAMKQWKALELWTVDYLIARCGGTLLELSVTTLEKFRRERGSLNSRLDAAASNAIARLKQEHLKKGAIWFTYAPKYGIQKNTDCGHRFPRPAPDRSRHADA